MQPRGTLLVEGYGRVGYLKQVIIRAAAFLCRLDVEFAPHGKEGDLWIWWFFCQDCGKGFHAATSVANQEIVTCPRCKVRYLTGNNVKQAWIIGKVEG